MVAGITGNCVCIVYEDDSLEIMAWKDVGQLVSPLKHLVIRVFHQQSEDISPMPDSSEVRFAAGDGVEALFFVEGRGLMIRDIRDAPPSAAYHLFEFLPPGSSGNGQTHASIDISIQNRFVLIGGARSVSVSVPFSETMYEERVQAAKDRTDLPAFTDLGHP